MNALLYLAVFAALAGVSYLLTLALRRYALARGILARPTDRGLHERPIPSGGGLSVSLLTLLGASAAHVLFSLPDGFVAALLGGGGLLTLLGWVDDRRALGPAPKAALQAAAALWAVALLGVPGGPEWLVPHPAIVPLRYLFAALGIVWFVNLFNFMDGADGLAGLQALMAGLVSGLFLWAAGATGAAVVLLTMAAAAAGFLLLNRPPARIFMGDAGSCFLGYLFGVFAFCDLGAQGLPFFYWLLLLSLFVCDATLTLSRRVARGERWYRAHRQHAYQRLILSGRSHGDILAGFAAIHLLLLVPLCALGLYHPPWLPLLAAGWYSLLAALWWALQARYP